MGGAGVEGFCGGVFAEFVLLVIKPSSEVSKVLKQGGRERETYGGHPSPGGGAVHTGKPQHKVPVTGGGAGAGGAGAGGARVGGAGVTI